MNTAIVAVLFELNRKVLKFPFNSLPSTALKTLTYNMFLNCNVSQKPRHL